MVMTWTFSAKEATFDAVPYMPDSRSALRRFLDMISGSTTGVASRGYHFTVPYSVKDGEVYMAVNGMPYRLDFDGTTLKYSDGQEESAIFRRK